MILFGRVYGAIIAAVIFAFCTLLQLPFLHSIVVTVALILVLGIARPHILQFTAKITERANSLRRNMGARVARKSGEANAPGA